MAYKLEGDSLTIARTIGDIQNAPGDFSSRPGDHSVVIAYRRRIPKEDAARAEEKPQRTGLQRAESLALERRELSDALTSRAADVEMLEVEVEARKAEVLKLTDKLISIDEATPPAQPEASGRATSEFFEARKKAAIDRLERSKQALRESIRKLRSLKGELEDGERAIAKVADAETQARKRPGKPGAVQPGDRVVVEVLEALPGRPVSGERVVRDDGTLSLGFYGEIPVAGLTPREIKVKVVEHMKNFLTDESLGLVEQDDAGNKRNVAPADSDRVYADLVPANDRDSRIDELERKLEQIRTSK